MPFLVDAVTTPILDLVFPHVHSQNAECSDYEIATPLPSLSLFSFCDTPASMPPTTRDHTLP